jgi:hypothetical protein
MIPFGKVFQLIAPFSKVNIHSHKDPGIQIVQRNALGIHIQHSVIGSDKKIESGRVKVDDPSQ